VPDKAKTTSATGGPPTEPELNHLDSSLSQIESPGPGNVHSAEDWPELLLPEIERHLQLGKEGVLRTDAAFAKPEIYEARDERA
jgi:hypothetical protein